MKSKAIGVRRGDGVPWSSARDAIHARAISLAGYNSRRHSLVWLLCSVLVLSNSLASAAESVQRFFVSEIDVQGEHPIPAAELDAMLEPYLGEQAGFLDLRNAAQTVEEALNARGLPFHRVVIPAQKTTSGVIRFEIVAFKLNEIVVEGNEHFSSDNVLRGVPALKKEATPDTKTLARALSLANIHPSKQVGLTMRRSDVPRHIDAVLKVTDQRPHQLFTSLNNRGSDETGEERWSVGYQYSNLFNRDQTITATYTTSPGHFDDVEQYGVNYVAPVYAIAAEFSAFYTKSSVQGGVVANSIDVSGAGEFYGLTFTKFLRQIGPLRQRVRISYQDRLFENDAELLNNGVRVGGIEFADVRSQPLSFEYLGELVWPRANLSFSASYVTNTGTKEGNSELDYGGGQRADGTFVFAGRNGADQDWDLFRFSAAVDYKLPNAMLIRSRFSGQRSNEPLISGEQFGLGGMDSIRGFDEREVAGDDGYALNTEVWAPPNKYGVQILGFLDMGYGYRWETGVGEKEALTLTSVGIGFRWQPVRYLSLLADYAHVINGEGTIVSGHDKIHFTVLARW